VSDLAGGVVLAVNVLDKKRILEVAAGTP